MDAMKRYCANYMESHPQIELNRLMVRRADMEPGHGAVSAVIFRQVPDKARSKTPAAMCRMGANTADFGIVVQHQPFAAHGNQFPVGSHAEVRTHLTGSAAKKAGERQICERYHFGGVCAGERKYLERVDGSDHVFGQHHLETLQGFDKRQLGYAWVTFS